LLTSGSQGELLEWNLDRLRRKSPGAIFVSDGNEARVVHREHQRFDIPAVRFLILK
jgi:hypothetical protein